VQNPHFFAIRKQDYTFHAKTGTILVMESIVQFFVKAFWRWDVVGIGSTLLYGFGVGAMYGNDYLVAAALYFLGVTWLTSKLLAWEETRVHPQKNGISVVILILAAAIFTSSLFWIRHTWNAKISEGHPQKEVVIAPSEQHETSDGVTAQRTECVNPLRFTQQDSTRYDPEPLYVQKVVIFPQPVKNTLPYILFHATEAIEGFNETGLMVNMKTGKVDTHGLALKKNQDGIGTTDNHIAEMLVEDEQKFASTESVTFELWGRKRMRVTCVQQPPLP
jgi:hypothetical protein